LAFIIFSFHQLDLLSGKPRCQSLRAAEKVFVIRGRGLPDSRSGFPNTITMNSARASEMSLSSLQF
jgi:hypothetical protein